jgi:hypothetical protein
MSVLGAVKEVVVSPRRGLISDPRLSRMMGDRR